MQNGAIFCNFETALKNCQLLYGVHIHVAYLCIEHYEFGHILSADGEGGGGVVLTCNFTTDTVFDYTFKYVAFQGSLITKYVIVSHICTDKCILSVNTSFTR